ncbi:hypothetical protein [Intrasporangium sp.]|uniref:hypothetical protein n=1 Tax=Intrasporangium sp. TaxID=1925024 RepID=UPI00293A8910|nr:hypothetical protein [Intrasporangium sp.]MDV3222722.1 hypothetical protein [Intrasporangium sp.]
MPSITRRVFGRGGAAAALGLLAAVASPQRAGATPPSRKPLLVGANPAVQLFDRDGACTAYASCWVVDWSQKGSGTAVVLWQPDQVTVHGADPTLGAWLADHFVRHFPELDGLPWSEPQFHPEPARIEVSLASGLKVIAGGLTVGASGVLDRRAFATDAFPLGGVDHSLSLVIGPCETGSITVRGQALPGSVRRSGTPDRPGSSAFIADAEVWQL